MISLTCTQIPLVVALSLFVLLVLRRLRLQAHSKGRTYPPGPPRLPVIGNLLDLTRHVYPWKGYQQLSAIYGGMVHLQVMGNHLLVVSDADIAFELLEKRSAIYSSRAESTMIKLRGWDWEFAFMPYGQWWRRHRRIFWQYFHPTALRALEPAQEEGAHRLLSLLLNRTSSVNESIHLAVMATLCRAAHGLDVEDEGFKSVVKGFDLDVLVSGGSVLEYFPWLARVPTWLPGTDLLRKLEEGRRASYAMREIPWARAKEAMSMGKESKSIASAMLEKLSQLDAEVVAEEEGIAMSALAHSYAAGIDTIWASIQTLFVACTLHPEVQHRAQSELDAVVGPGRLPTLADRDQLPYVNAVVREMMRWHPVVPLGVVHTSTADDEYEGYFIPQGTGVMVNVWEMLHDPVQYPQPDTFNPERFLRDGKLDPSVRDPMTIGLGFGRRICPGRYLADTTVFLFAASVLHVCDIFPPLDDEGRTAQIEPRPTVGLVSFLENWDCVVKPRTAAAESLVRHVPV